ncbi:RNF32 [Scenedesmus sp. PABB004]|nr:RNF32 [Scenedesmus sp. PABB004]
MPPRSQVACLAVALQDHMSALLALPGARPPGSAPGAAPSLAQRLGLAPAPAALLTPEQWEAVHAGARARADPRVDACAVCLEPFADCATAQALLSCGHVFHAACLRAFEAHARSRACPLCRAPCYQTRAITDAADARAAAAATRIQAVARGWLARRALVAALVRQPRPPRAQRLRRLWAAGRLAAAAGAALAAGAGAGAGDLDGLFAELDASLGASRRLADPAAARAAAAAGSDGQAAGGCKPNAPAPRAEPGSSSHNKTYTCKWCSTTFSGSVTRALAHLAGIVGIGVAACAAISEGVRNKFKAEWASKQAATKKRRAPLGGDAQQQRSTPACAGSPPGGSGHSSAASRVQGPLERSFQVAEIAHVNAALTDFLYAEGLPLRLVKSPWLRAFVNALQGMKGKYTLPSYDNVRTRHLQEAKDRVDKKLQAWQQRCPQSGVTICSDGWSDRQGNPLLNVLAVNPKGAKFITAVDTTGKTKNAEYVAGVLMNVIEMVGPEHVVQVCTDCAAVCKAAGVLIMARWPHITWSPCVAHVCDLALEDLFSKVDSFKAAHEENKAFITFVRNHHSTLAAWKQFNHSDATGATDAERSELQRTNKLQLIKPGETRFASAHLMLERVAKLKSKIRQYVVSEHWAVAISNFKPGDKALAKKFESLVTSAKFWEQVELAVQVKSLLREMAEQFSSVQQEQEPPLLRATDWELVQKIWDDRWDMMDSPLHGAGYTVDPEYLGDQGIPVGNITDKCVRDWHTMCEKLLPTIEERTQAMAGYMAFRNGEGSFGQDLAKAVAPITPAHQWWETYGQAWPEAQRVAVRVLSQVASASSCERAWSAYDFIHNKRRNRLTPQRARDLVYVFTNTRLATKISAEGGEQFHGWDEEEEMSESEQ